MNEPDMSCHRSVTGVTARIDCFKCRHFFVTWDRKFPYGCRFMGFKSKVMPSQEVLNASRKACQSFKDKLGGG